MPRTVGPRREPPDAPIGAAPEGALLPRRAAAPTFSAGAGCQRTPAPARASSPRDAALWIRADLTGARSIRGHLAPTSSGTTVATRRRRGRAGRGRTRRQGTRPAADEDAGHRAPAGRDGGVLRAGPLGEAGGGARLGAATSGPRPRPRWSARWPTGSPSPPCSGTRWACRSRTPRSSRRKKDQIGDSLGDFVGENFLSEDVVRDRLRAHRASRGGVGEWLGRCRQRRARHRRARDALRGARRRAARRGRAGGASSQAVARGCSSSRPARRSARCWAGSSPTARTSRLVDLRPRPGLRLADASNTTGDADRSRGGRRSGRPRSSTSASRAGCTASCCASPGRCATTRTTRCAGRSTRFLAEFAERPAQRPGHHRAGRAAQDQVCSSTPRCSGSIGPAWTTVMRLGARRRGGRRQRQLRLRVRDGVAGARQAAGHGRRLRGQDRRLAGGRGGLRRRHLPRGRSPP